tara:strand:- start:982 stop:1185 length:204 start_codon:yes stop_codon:yes gene_type:complete
MLPTAVNAENYWLVFGGKRSGGLAYSWQIPTSSKQECEVELEKILDSKNWSRLDLYDEGSGICIKGK